MASLKVRPVKPQIRMAKMKNIRINFTRIASLFRWQSVGQDACGEATTDRI
ncbi:hypothetical protein OkiPb00511_28600 [Escherichia coli]